MSWLEKIVGVFADKALIPKVENVITECIDTSILDKQIDQKERDCLLDKYGNKQYYASLDKYITNNNIISLLISAARGKTNIQPIDKSDFLEKNNKEFINQYPQYKNTVAMYDITTVFAEIYDHVFWAINLINPHTQLGKLQNDMHRSEAESQYREDRIFAMLQDISEKLNEMPMAPIIGVVDIATQELGPCSDEINRFTQKIKDIETEYQCSNQFEEALSQYLELLQSITSILRGQPQSQIDTLICTLNCNVALCQSNLGNVDRAFRSLSTIQPEVASNSRTYHFVYAAIIINHNITEKYATAKEHLDQSLSIDSAYSRAFMLRQYLISLMGQMDCNTNIEELNNHFAVILTSGDDRRLIADYYMNRGLIYRAYGEPLTAISDFSRAIEYGYDSIVANFNIAAALYNQATLGVSKDIRVLFPAIDYSLMLHAMEILRTILADKQTNNQIDCVVKKLALSLYVSSCGLLGISHKLTPVKTYLCLAEEYETTRALLLGSDDKLTNDEISLLDDKDQLLINIRSLLDAKSYSKIENEIVNLINANSKSLSSPVFYILLQIYIISKQPAKYWQYRDIAIAQGVFGTPINIMDACVYELEGNISKSKIICDDIANTSNYYPILENVLRFYERNLYDEECSNLFLRIHDLWKKKSINIDDTNSFYSNLFSFFIKQHNPIVEKLLTEITPDDDTSIQCYYHINAAYYEAINDVTSLYNSLEKIDQYTFNFQVILNMVVCLRWLFKLDDAYTMGSNLLDNPIDEKDKVKVFWLISDILLLNNKTDDSYEWAKKAHDLTALNPYEPSHQAFLTRCVRCGRHDGLSNILEYKNEHPVVVNWFQAFSISDNKNFIEQIAQQFPDLGNLEDKEKEVSDLYRKGNMPINMVLRYYNGEWWKLFQFAETNKLNIWLGDKAMLEDEKNLITDALVVDAQTLIIMAYYGCLKVLQKIKCIHISYGSIATLQYCYISSESDYIVELIKWLTSTNNITYDPDGFIDEDSIPTKAFSRDFISGCNLALRNKIPFLYYDHLARKLKSAVEIGIPKEIQFISIPALCYLIERDHPNELSQMLYNLLKGCAFISFSADTIIYQISKNNYQVSKKILEPFLICKSSYDMESFAAVYLQSIYRLQKDHLDSSIVLAKIIISDASRVWRRGTHYRDMAESFSDSDAMHKATAIHSYVSSIFKGVRGIFLNLPRELIEPCAALERLVSETV